MRLTNTVWIAGYPKSGNTWLRFLVYNLLYGAPSSSAEVNKRITSVHGDNFPADCADDDNAVMHSHLSCDKHVELFGAPAGFVYVIRNPLDAMMSHANFYVLTQLDHYLEAQGAEAKDAGAEHAQALAASYVDEFLAAGRDRLGLGIGYGTWSENVRSWLELRDSDTPHVVLRYEDLIRDTAAEMARVARFFGMEPGTSDLEALVENSSFRAMRAMEEREIQKRAKGRFYRGDRHAAHAMGYRFMHRGTVGWGADALSDAAWQALTRKFRPALDDLGYRFGERQIVVDACPHDLDSCTPLHDFGHAA